MTAMGAIDHPGRRNLHPHLRRCGRLGYCRPVTFHRHEGKFTVDLDDGSAVQITGHRPADLPPALKRVPGLQTALGFYRLARTPQYQADGADTAAHWLSVYDATGG